MYLHYGSTPSSGIKESEIIHEIWFLYFKGQPSSNDCWKFEKTQKKVLIFVIMGEWEW